MTAKTTTIRTKRGSAAATPRFDAPCSSSPSTNYRAELDQLVKLLEDDQANNNNSMLLREGVIAHVAEIVSEHLSDLSNCSYLAGTVVDGLFLPYLEGFVENDDPSLSALGSRSIDTAVQVLHALTRVTAHGKDHRAAAAAESPHATQLLAPLVLEVSDAGAEEQKPNPFRMRIFALLQSLLRATTTCSEETADLAALRYAAAQTLCQLLQSVHSLEGTSKHAGGRQLDVDPVLLHQFFWQALLEPVPHGHHVGLEQRRLVGLEPQLLELSLELLQWLARRHPETSSQLTALLLLQQQPSNHQRRTTVQQKQSSCQLACACLERNSFDTAAFVQVLHGTYGNKPSRRAARLGTLLLDQLQPLSSWDQWLERSNNNNASSLRSRTAPLTFGDRVRRAFVRVMAVCQCCLLQQQQPGGGDDDDKQPALLAGTLLRRVPFDEKETLLMDAGTSLASVLLERFLKTESCEQQQVMAEALVKAIGGSETPQGIFLTMSLPMKRFLDSSRGHQWLEKLLPLKTTNSSPHVPTVLHAVCRTHPRPFLDSRSLWSAFLNHILGHSSGNKEDWQALVSLLQGRRDLLSERSADGLLLAPQQVVHEIVIPELRIRLEQVAPANTQAMALSAYGALVSDDWDVLMAAGVAFDHVAAIAAICKGKNTSAKTKKIAFKALGDVSTNLFACRAAKADFHDGEASRRLCRCICQPLEAQLEQQEVDETGSMALYALGNLSRILRESDSTAVVIDPVQWDKFAAFLLRITTIDVCNSDGASFDAKVQTNAIRALGHMVCLMCFKKDGFIVCHDDRGKLLNEALRVFSIFVRRTILLGQGKLQGDLSWKGRSAVKKIGWGACHSLSLVLPLVQGFGDLDLPGRDATRDCLLTLMECVSNLNCLHEKVAVVAMSALCSVNLAQPSLRLHQPKNRHALPLGPLIVQCLRWLGECGEDALSPKVVAQVESLLLHALACCGISDAEIVLSSAHNSDGGVAQQLHDWLVLQHSRVDRSGDQEAIQHTFDTFALAMQKRPDLLGTVDVKIEQQYAGWAKLVVSRRENQRGEAEDEL